MAEHPAASEYELRCLSPQDRRPAHTSWRKLIPRMIGASNKGYAVRVQVLIDGDWRYLGQRRPHRG